MYHHIFNVPGVHYGETITIVHFGDLQMGTEGFCKEAWQEFRNETKSDKNTYFIGHGDYEDWLRPSMRARLYGSLSHDDSARKQLDDRVRKYQDDVIDKMDFMRGKIIGFCKGHHDFEFITGMSSTQRLAEALGATYLGWQSSIRLILARKTHDEKQGRSTYAYTMVVTHGNANARRVGASTLWLENNLMQGWVADQYVMGHGCKSAAWAPVERHTVRRLGPPGEIITIPRCMIIGGFSKGYTNGWETSYVERSGFVPQPIMWGLVRIKICKKKAIADSRGINRYTDILDIENVNKGPGAQAFLYEGGA